jgi:hypothetical protein
MHRPALLLLFAPLACVPSVYAQTSQTYCDGLVSVSAAKVLDQDRQVAFDVCAKLVRQEKTCPVEVRLTFRSVSGQVLAEVSPVLYPQFAAPVCQRIPLPPEARDMQHWGISRFRCRP